MCLIRYVLSAALVVHLATSLENPCVTKNMTIMSGSSFKSLVEPGNCGRANVNESEFRTAPSIILHNSGSKTKDKYTLMVMREKKNIHDQFELMWLLSNISPLTNSLTANKTRTTFFPYTPLTANGTGKYWVLAFLQNTKNGLLSVGLKSTEYANFWPQIWIQRNSKWIQKLVGGLVFTVYPAKTKPRTRSANGTGMNYTNNTDVFPSWISTNGLGMNYTNSTAFFSNWTGTANGTGRNQTNMYPNHTNPVYPAPAPMPPHGGGYIPQPVPPQGGSYPSQPVPPHGGSYYPPPPPPQGGGYFPPPVPPHSGGYPPQPNPPPNTVIHHHYVKDKKKKGGASAVTAILPLVIGLAWATYQL
ncbi:uncharacterized protein LOC106661785 isoform X1 [Cimex lectularius]|uniref:Uncharacterized protein n=1 Tax=Cimex lectularius TaxID=79782 RepID=A0A8I6R985_CIMLE|nr:uncharacterized protein LOC106661785 isoform X1 [Cimex lectularius]XP_014240902.1 uncharacterized protein LOC106661785 isoform X1 [Cimex lectularius]